MRANLEAWLNRRGHDLEPQTPESRRAQAVILLCNALEGTEQRRDTWRDSDYLVAVLALLVDADVARKYALKAEERLQKAEHPVVEAWDRWQAAKAQPGSGIDREQALDEAWHDLVTAIGDLKALTS